MAVDWQPGMSVDEYVRQNTTAPAAAPVAPNAAAPAPAAGPTGGLDWKPGMSVDEYVAANKGRVQPPPSVPKGPEQEWAPLEGAKEVAVSAGRGLLLQAPTAVIDAAEALFGDVGELEAPEERNVFERFRDTAKASIDRRLQEGLDKGLENKTLDPFGLIDLQDVREFESGLGFTLGNLAVGAVGAAAMPFAPWVGFGLASGLQAYGSSKGDIQQSFLEATNEEWKTKYNRDMTGEERMAALAQFEEQATETGLWEAVPETLGTILELAILKMPLTKLLGKSVGTAVTSKIASTLGRDAAGQGAEIALRGAATAAAGFPIELGTETVTQIGQSQAIEGTILDQREDALSFTNPADWLTASKEVLPQTLLLTGFMGGGRTGFEATRMAFNRAKFREHMAEAEELKSRVFDDDGNFLPATVMVDARDENGAPIYEADGVTPKQAEKANLSARTAYFKSLYNALQADPASAADALDNSDVRQRLEKLTTRFQHLSGILSNDKAFGPLGAKAKDQLRREYDVVSSSLDEVMKGVVDNNANLNTKIGSEEQNLYRENSRLFALRDLGFDETDIDKLSEDQARAILTSKGGLNADGEPVVGFKRTNERYGSSLILPETKADRYEELQSAVRTGTVLEKAERTELASLQQQGLRNRELSEIAPLVDQHLNPGIAAQRELGFTGELGDYIPAVAPTAEAKATADALGAAFGKRIVFFRQGVASPIGIHGFAPSTDTNILFVNADLGGSKGGLNFIIGHELTHQIKAEGNQTFQELFKFARRSVNEVTYKKYRDALSDARTMETGTETVADDGLVLNEFMADFVGNRFNDETLIDKLAKENPTLLAKFGQALKNFLGRTARNMGMLGPNVQAADMFRNYTQMSQRVDAALQEYAAGVAAGTIKPAPAPAPVQPAPAQPEVSEVGAVPAQETPSVPPAEEPVPQPEAPPAQEAPTPSMEAFAPTLESAVEAIAERLDTFNALAFEPGDTLPLFDELEENYEQLVETFEASLNKVLVERGPVPIVEDATIEVAKSGNNYVLQIVAEGEKAVMTYNPTDRKMTFESLEDTEGEVIADTAPEQAPAPAPPAIQPMEGIPDKAPSASLERLLMSAINKNIKLPDGTILGLLNFGAAPNASQIFGGIVQVTGQVGDRVMTIQRDYGELVINENDNTAFIHEAEDEGLLAREVTFDGNDEASREAQRKAYVNEMMDKLHNQPEQTIINELFQNSLDAFRTASGKPVKTRKDVYFAVDRRTEVNEYGEEYDATVVTIVDNGKGMSIDGVERNFLVRGGTNKGGESSGGFGQAKMAFLMPAQRFELTTTHKGKTTRTIATMEQLRGRLPFKLDDEGENLKESGTTLRIFYYADKDAAKAKATVAMQKYEFWSQLQDYANSIYFPVNLTLEDQQYTEVIKMVRQDFSKAKAKYDPVVVKDEDGNNYTVHFIMPPPGTLVKYNGYGNGPFKPEIRLYNKGIYLHDIGRPYHSGGPSSFLESQIKGMSQRPDFVVAINFDRTAPTGTSEYPFTNNRTNLRTVFQDAMKDLINDKVLIINRTENEAKREQIISQVHEAPKINGVSVLMRYEESGDREKAKTLLSQKKHAAYIGKFTRFFEQVNRLLKVGFPEVTPTWVLTVDPTTLGFHTDVRSTGVAVNAISVWSHPAYVDNVIAYEIARSNGADRQQQIASELVLTMLHEFGHDITPPETGFRVDPTGHGQNYVQNYEFILNVVGSGNVSALQGEMYELIREHEADIREAAGQLSNLGAVTDDVFGRDRQSSTDFRGVSPGSESFPAGSVGSGFEAGREDIGLLSREDREVDGKVIQLVTKGERQFIKDFREDLARRVEHNVRMVEAWDGWRWEIGERYKSLATGKVWTVTGKVWRDRKNEGVYYMETADGERATFIPSVAHEGFIKMTGPTGSLARDLTTDELRELRVLRAAVQYEGATYISPAGQAHWRALQKIPKIAMLRSEAERDAALDEVFANSESGFVDADGNFMTREESAQWVKTNDPRTFKVLQKHHFSYFPGEPRLESMGYFDAMGLYHEGDVAYLSRDMTNDNTAIPTVEVKGKTVTYYAQTWNPITRREIIRDLRERTDVESVVYQVVSRPPASGIPVILAEIKGSRVDAMGGLLEQNFERERRNKKVTPGSLSRAHWSGVVQGMGNKYKEVLRRAKDDARRVNTLKDAAKLFERQWLSKLDFMLKVLPFSSKVDIYGDMFKAGVRGERDLLQELYTMIKQASYEQNKAPGEADLLYKEAEKLTGGKNTQAWKNLELAMDVNTFLEMEPWKPFEEQPWRTDEDWENPPGRGVSRTEVTGLTREEAYRRAVSVWNQVGQTNGLQDKYQEIIKHMESMRDKVKNAIITKIWHNESLTEDDRMEMIAQITKDFGKVRGPYAPLIRFGEYVAVVKKADSDNLEAYSHFESLRELEDFVEATQDADTFVMTYVKGEARTLKGSPLDMETQARLNKIVSAVLDENAKPEPTTDRRGDVIPGAAERNAARRKEADLLSATLAQQINVLVMRSAPENSAMKHMMQRKGFKGYSPHMMRSYVDYMMKQGRLLSALKYNDLIDAKMRDIKNTAMAYNDETTELGYLDKRKGIMANRVANDIDRHVWMFRNEHTHPLARNLGKLSLIWYLSSPSQYLVNFSQVFVVAMPHLVSKFGMGKSTNALKRTAMRLTGTEKNLYSDEKIKEIEELLELSGVNQVLTYKEYMQNRANWDALNMRVGDYKFPANERRDFFSGRVAKNGVRLNEYQQRLHVLLRASQNGTLDLTLSHDALDISQGEDRTGFMYKMSWAMRLSEAHSRKTTLLTSYELYREGMDFEEAFDQAERSTNRTMFDYSKENRPEILAGSWMRVATQFQTFRINMLYRLSRQFYLTLKPINASMSEEEQATTLRQRKEAKRELVGIMGMVGILGGVFGLPMVKTAFRVIDLAFGDDDDPFDAKMEFERWVMENFGETLGRALLQGAPTLGGWNVSRRVGLESIYPFESMAMDIPEWMGPTSSAHWFLSQFGGPAYGIFADFITGVQMMSQKGEYLDGMVKMTPKVVKDGLRAMQLATDGLKDNQGRTLMSDDDIGYWDILSMAAGINPDGLSQTLEANRKMSTISVRLSKRRGEIMRDFDRAAIKGDTEGKFEALEELKEFNKNNPWFAITTGDISNSLKRSIYEDQAILQRRQVLVAKKYRLPIYSKQDLK